MGRMRERDPEYGDTEGRTAARVLDDNARCMMHFKRKTIGNNARIRRLKVSCLRDDR